MVSKTLLKTLFSLLGRNALAVVLLAVVAVQAYQVRQRDRQVNDLKEALAQANGAIVRLERSLRDLPPGKPVVVEVPRPTYVPVPGPLRVEYVKVPGPTVTRIETKVETLRLPGETIERVVDRSPQSIVAQVTATRDIKAGETFRVTFSQVQPGVWQPMLELNAPVEVDARVITPEPMVPRQVEPRRWSVSLYGGYSFLDGPVTGARVGYSLSASLVAEGQVERRWQANATDYRVSLAWRW